MAEEATGLFCSPLLHSFLSVIRVAVRFAAVRYVALLTARGFSAHPTFPTPRDAPTDLRVQLGKLE